MCRDGPSVVFQFQSSGEVEVAVDDLQKEAVASDLLLAGCSEWSAPVSEPVHPIPQVARTVVVMELFCPTSNSDTLLTYSHFDLDTISSAYFIETVK